MLNHLQESDSIFNSELIRDYYLFSKAGFSKDIQEKENIHLIDLKTMLS